MQLPHPFTSSHVYIGIFTPCSIMFGKSKFKHQVKRLNLSAVIKDVFFIPQCFLECQVFSMMQTSLS